MLQLHFSQLLLLLWKLSTVYVIPIIIQLYIDLIDSYFDGFSFQQLDQGQNIHKLAVLAIYLLYLLFWNRCNKHVISYLKKLEYQ